LSDDAINITRREFIKRSVAAGSAVAGTGGISYLLYDRTGPVTGPDGKKANFPDFTVPAIPGKYMSVVRGAGRDACLRKAIELLGGMDRFISRGDRVIIKPNIAFASSPSLGATSHPDIVTGIARMCYAAGAESVSIMDNPINDPAGCYLLSGIEDAAAQIKAKLIYPGENLFEKLTLEGGRLIRNWPVFSKPLMGATKLIGTAPVKNHHRSGASMSMKNWYGLLGGRRNIFHQNIHLIITELAMMFKPTLVVLDGFDVMMQNGPTGGSLSDLMQKNTIIASTDQVAADSFGAGLLGMTVRDLPYLSMAEKAGAGTTDYASLKPVKIEV